MVENIIFNNNDYNSDNGMNTKIWGPPLWFILHIISFNYPVSPSKLDKKNYFIFLKSLENVLPCKSCRNNFKDHLGSIDMSIFDSRDTFSRYIYKLHNIVNNSLNKQKYSLSYKSVKNIYEYIRYHDNNINYKYNNDLQSTIKIIKYNKNKDSINITNSVLSIKN